MTKRRTEKATQSNQTVKNYPMVDKPGISDGPKFKREKMALNVELSPEEEAERREKQAKANEQFSIDNPKLANAVFTPVKPTTAGLDEKAKAYMALKRQFELDD